MTVDASEVAVDLRAKVGEACGPCDEIPAVSTVARRGISARHLLS
jgi:hypothetical protein